MKKWKITLTVVLSSLFLIFAIGFIMCTIY